MTKTPLSTEILTSDPKAYFDQFDAIVLVANSRDALESMAGTRFGERPLYIFFNKVFRILSDPFDGPSLLISRSSPVGSSLIYRGELAKAASRLDGPAFEGIINLKVGEQELLSPIADFRRDDVAHLDLTAFFDPIYPARYLPSTGFAFATWLCSLKPQGAVYLVGFTGIRQSTWRIYGVHDWTWEQTVLRVLYKHGRISEMPGAGTSSRWPVRAFVDTFAEVRRDDVEEMALQVLSDRLAGTNKAVDEIFRSIKLQIGIAQWLRAIRPKSRKARRRAKLLQRIEAEKRGKAGS